MKALYEFFYNERSNLEKYINRWIDDFSDGEDIVQEVMVKIVSNPDFNSQVENLKSYIYKAIKNKIIDRFRAKRKIISIEKVKQESLIDNRMNIYHNFENSMLINSLNKAIEKLKPDEKQLLIDIDIEGKTFEQVSKEINVPVGTLLSKKHRIIKKLKVMLDEEVK